LIELVVVIVILGILSAVALPRFVDLSGQAGRAAAQGVAGSISSATSINYAARKANHGSAIAVTGCIGAGSVDANKGTLLAGGLPANYTITGAGTCTDGNTATCTITNNNVTPPQTASAVIVCAS
jgi:type II secretory pathway pseudopilin PulG